MRAGFTLIEVIVALGLFALIGAAGFTLLDGVLRAQEATENRLQRLAEVQRALLVVSTDLDQITGGLAGSAATLTLQKDDLSGARVIVRYDLNGSTMTRTISGPGGERAQVLIEGVSSVTWTFHRRAGDWLDTWPQPAIPTVAALPGQPVVTPLPTPAEGVVAVAVDVSLNGFDGRPGSTLRRVASVPLMQGAS